jgi:hypothetical protein
MVVVGRRGAGEQLACWPFDATAVTLVRWEDLDQGACDAARALIRKVGQSSAAAGGAAQGAVEGPVSREGSTVA